MKGDDPDEDEVTKLLEGDNKEEEPEDGEEGVIYIINLEVLPLFCNSKSYGWVLFLSSH